MHKAAIKNDNYICNGYLVVDYMLNAMVGRYTAREARSAEGKCVLCVHARAREE